ncbi:MAG: lipopolysaccharide heptosyltransferase II [Candidatus Omnitrophica bacterium]|nr:lipopolysaccharide heptosyltransferase II [Candidatus Omnitrophota bacterium]MDD5238156.1 lipopolysaccharide heptosyltransferase II [Candidatus Omnitrophota bacterium]
MERFLIINPFGIGDVLFATPVIENIKFAYPDSFIGYWCNERVEDIIANNPHINKIFALSRGDIKKIYRKSWLQGFAGSISLYFRLKKERFDVSLDYSLDHRYSLTAKFAGVKRRIGFNYRNRGRFLTNKIDLTGYSDKHVVEYYLDLLRLINITPKKFALQLKASDGEKAAARKILAGCGVNDGDLLIGIAPGAGASWGIDASLKHWPRRHFAGLADKLIESYGAKILILGDTSERLIAQEITRGMRNKAVDLAGKTKLSELIAIIDNLEVLIANDGGPLHMAAALNKKTVSFFGPVDPKVYGPYPSNEKRHIVLRRNLECSPCYRDFRLNKCIENRDCLEKIDIEQALEAVSNLLSTGEELKK